MDAAPRAGFGLASAGVAAFSSSPSSSIRGCSSVSSMGHSGSVPPPAGVSSPLLWGTEEHLAELFGDDVAWTHRERTFTWRFTSPAAFVECFATYYGPTVKALEAAGTGSDALLQDLEQLAASADELGEPGAIRIPATYLESVGRRV